MGEMAVPGGRWGISLYGSPLCLPAVEATRRRPLLDGDMYRGRCGGRNGVDLAGEHFCHRG